MFRSKLVVSHSGPHRRRMLVRRRIGAVFAASMAVTLAACTGGVATPEKTGPWDMRVQVSSDFQTGSLIPGKGAPQESYAIATDNVIEGLLRPDRDGNLKGLLATSWKLVDDMTWRFVLRSGVKFQDGTPFDAKAVKYSFDRIYHDKELGSLMTQWFKDVDHVEVIDELTVDFKMVRPAALLPQVLTMLPIVPESLDITDATTWKGTGPYKLTKLEPNSAVLTKVDDYWGGKTDGPDTVTVAAQTEAAAMTAALSSNGADLGLYISPDLVKSVPNYQAMPAVQVMSFGLNSFRPPFNNPKIREAASLAFDIEGNRTALFGNDLSQEAKCQMVAEGIDGYAPSVKTPTFDPDRAKHLVAEAGSAADAPIRVNVAAGRYPNGEEIAKLMVEQLNNVGLHAELYVQDGVSQTKNVTNPDKASRPEMWLTSTSWAAGMIYSTNSLAAPTAVVAGINHDEFPDLWPAFQAALRETDDQKRKGLFDTAAQQLCDTHTMIFAYMPKRIIGLPDGPTTVPDRPDFRMIYSEMTR